MVVVVVSMVLGVLVLVSVFLVAVVVAVELLKRACASSAL